MPGNVALPAPVGVFPKHLSTKFVEKRAYAELQSQFHDSSINRSQLALASRKSFELAEKLTSAETTTLKTFYDAHGGGLIPFFFYNPFEVCPPGTNYDPTFVNPVGRYVMRFGNDWDQITGLMRTASPDMTLVEVSGSLGGTLAETPVPIPGTTLIVRPLTATFEPGTAMCSGTGSVTPSPDGTITDPSGHIFRDCYSGLSVGAYGVYGNFIVPYPSFLIGASITMSISGGRHRSSSDYAVTSYSAAWYPQLQGSFFGFLGNGVTSFGDPGAWPAFTSQTGTYTFDPGDHIQTLDWTSFIVWFSQISSLNSAFSTDPSNDMYLSDAYLTLNY